MSTATIDTVEKDLSDLEESMCVERRLDLIEGLERAGSHGL